MPTEDDLRAALRLLEQRAPNRIAPASDESGLSPLAGSKIVPAGRRRWAAPVLAAAVVIAVVAGTTAVIAHRAHPDGQQLQPGMFSPSPAPGVDFSQDPEANGAASDFGQKLLAVLPQLPGYAGLQIVRYGVEIDLVGPPSAAVLAAVARNATQYQGKPIPIRYRSVRHTERELQAMMRRVMADQSYWLQQGIDPTSWLIDLNSNTVQVWLAHYTKAYRDALIAHYGPDWVSVLPRDSGS